MLIPFSDYEYDYRFAEYEYDRATSISTNKQINSSTIFNY